MAYRGFVSSPGLTTHRRSDLKLLRQSWLWNNSSLAVKLAADSWIIRSERWPPGYCPCRHVLCWWAEKAGECSYWPGGIFQSCTMLLTGAVKRCESYFFKWKRDKSLLFCIEKWQIVTLYYKKLQIFTLSSK